jgi:hypothetical protein
MQRTITLLVLFISFNAAAQTSTIKGKVYDTTSKKGLAYSTISLVKAKDSTLVSFSKADSSGNFSLRSVPHGEYIISTSYVGFVPVWRPVSVNKDVVDMGNLEMTDIKFADEVVVRAKRPPVTINGDTLEFNTENFKTQPNAVVEDMLKKMPGITVDNDGTIRVNGQKVNRVLVNGKEFFTGDPKIATKNLSADAVDKVQVFDKKSDQSEFTGVDDGNTQKAINLKLKKDRNNALFGRVNAGAGTDKKYDAQANINRFKGEQQTSFIGMGNNTNKQGFSISDILNFTGEMAKGMRGGGGMVIRTGGGPDDNGLPVTGLGQNQQGVAQTFAAGVNYNDVWNKRTSVNANFVASDIDLNTKKNINRQYLYPGNNYNYTQAGYSDRIVQQQRAGFAIDQKLDSLTSIKITPQLSFQKNKNNSYSNYLSQALTGTKLNEGYTGNESVSDATNFATNMLFKKKFAKKGRTLSANVDLQYNHSASKGTQNSFFTTYNAGTGDDSTLNQRYVADALSRIYGASVTYTEPLDKRSILEMSVLTNRNLGESDRNTFDYNASSGKHDMPNAALSNSFRSDYVYKGGGMHYRTNHQKYNLTIGASLQDAVLKGINKTTGTAVEQSFTDVLPDAAFQWKFSQYSNINFNYNTNTQQPSVRQLQPVADVSDPLNAVLGNPGLKRSYNHSLSLNYFAADPLRGKNFFAFAAVNVTEDAIVNSDEIKPGGIRSSQPVNTNGIINAFSSVNMGFPVKKLKSRLELSLGYNFNRNISFVNQQKNTIENSSISPAIRWNFSIENKIDVFASARLNISNAKYSLQPLLNTDYLQQVYNLEMTNYLPWGIVLNNTLNYTKNSGRADGYNIGIPFWNASVAKSFLKNKRAEVKLSVADILDKNIGVSRTANQNYIEDLQYNVLRRYGLLSFTYALNKSGLGSGPRAVIRTIN